MGRTCTIEGCDTPHHAKGYCRKHYTEFCKRDNSVYIPPKIKNEFIIEGDIARMIICDRRGKPINETLIDAEDVGRVQRHRWFMQGKGYVQSQDMGLLHAFIIGAVPGRVTDHINKDKLDNRKANLRIATLSENGYNSKLPANNTSGVKGVSYHKQTGKWEAALETNGVESRKLFREFDDAVAYRHELEATELTFFNHDNT